MSVQTLPELYDELGEIQKQCARLRQAGDTAGRRALDGALHDAVEAIRSHPDYPRTA